MKTVLTFAIVGAAIYIAWRYLARPHVAPVQPASGSGGGIGSLCNSAAQVAGSSYGVGVPPNAGAQACGLLAPVATAAKHLVTSTAQTAAVAASRGASAVSHNVGALTSLGGGGSAGSLSSFFRGS